MGNNKAQGLFGFPIRRPVTITMIVFGVVVFGAVALMRIPTSLMPDLSYPSITIRTEFPGAAPEEVETNVSTVIEETLGIIPNLKSLTSLSKTGRSDVIMDFEWGTDMALATQEVSERLATINFADDIDKPLILRYDPSLDPVIRLALTGPQDLRDLRDFSEDYLKRELEKIDGLAAVKVKGGFEEEISVLIRENDLIARGLSLSTIHRRLRQENISVAGGKLKEGTTEYIVRAVNEFTNLEEISSLVIARQGDIPVRLSDVADVVRGQAERQLLMRVNGQEGVELALYREADANLVDLSKRIMDKVFAQGKPQKGGPKALSQQLPEESVITVTSNQAVFVKAAIQDVQKAMIVGGCLAIVVLFLFMKKMSTTLVVAISIPTSVVATFAAMLVFDVSLNIMSLGGLALGVGMLVDNAIVVLESIFRCREEGDAPTAAALRGVREVGTAVIASTMTTVSVFFPIVFVEGVAGQIFRDLALTVVFSLLSSLLVAVFFVPMLALQATKFETSKNTGPAPKTRLRFLLPKDIKQGFQSLFLFWKGFADDFKTCFSREETIGVFRIRPVAIKAWCRIVFFRIPFIPIWLLSLVLYVVFNIVFRVVVFAPLAIIFGALTMFFKAILEKAFALAKRTVFPLFDKSFQKVHDGYLLFLRSALDQKATAFMVGILSMVLTIFLFSRLDSELLPEVSQGLVTMEAVTPVGTPLEETAAILRALEAGPKDSNYVERTSILVGIDPEDIQEVEGGEHTATLQVTISRPKPPFEMAQTPMGKLVQWPLYQAWRVGQAFKPDSSLRAREEAVLEAWRAEAVKTPALQSKFSRPNLFETAPPLKVEIIGYDLSELHRLSDQAAELLGSVESIADVRRALTPGNPEVQILYNREKLNRLGLDPSQVANLVREKVQGEVPTRFKRAEDRIDIRVRNREQDRKSLADLYNMDVNPGGKTPIPLQAVANIVLAEGPSEIRRVDQQRVAALFLTLKGVGLSRASRDVEEALAGMTWPDGFDFRLAGQAQELEQSSKSLYLTLLLSLFLVYIFMASLFENYLHPFLIMFSIPLAFLGVALALLILGKPLSVIVFLGMLMLAGIVVNNAIILVDYTNHLREKGMALREAIVRAGEVRLRPILMTTATTVLGLLPMAFGMGEGSEIRTPLAVTVIAGLVASTVLTLVGLPVVYEILEEFRAKKKEASDEPAKALV